MPREAHRRIPINFVGDDEMRHRNDGQHKRFTICRACREIWAGTEDRETKRLLKYIVSLARAIVTRVEANEGRTWVHDIYVKRHEFDEVMDEVEMGSKRPDGPLYHSQSPT